MFTKVYRLCYLFQFFLIPLVFLVGIWDIHFRGTIDRWKYWYNNDFVNPMKTTINQAFGKKIY